MVWGWVWEGRIIAGRTHCRICFPDDWFSRNWTGELKFCSAFVAKMCYPTHCRTDTWALHFPNSLKGWLTAFCFRIE